MLPVTNPGALLLADYDNEREHGAGTGADLADEHRFNLDAKSLLNAVPRLI